MADYRHFIRKESDIPPLVDVVGVLSAFNLGADRYVLQMNPSGFAVGQEIMLSGFVANPLLNGVQKIIIVQIVQGRIFIELETPTVPPPDETGFAQRIDETTYREIFPLDIYRASILTEKAPNLEFGYRKKLSKRMLLTNIAVEGINDYSYFRDIETAGGCEDIEYIMKRFCSGAYETVLTGRFSIKDGEFVKDRCNFWVQPNYDDLYECLDSDIEFNILDTTPVVTTFYEGAGGPDYLFEFTRKFEDVLTFLVNNTCDKITQIVSDFFQINPLNVSDINYVTGEVNPYTEMTVSAKSDIKSPIPSNNATEAKITFKKFFEQLQFAFNVHYVIEGNVLRIEHESYFTKTLGLDLTHIKYDKYLVGTNKYTYDKDNMPLYEEWTMPDSGSIFRINYSEACSNSKEKKYVLDQLYTDLNKLINAPEQIKSLEGIVLFATRFNSGTSQYDILGTQNDELRLSTLVYKFFRHGRPQDNGTSDNYGEFVTITTKPNKIQPEINVPLCCSDTFNPNQYVKTSLGNGTVQSASLEKHSKLLSLNLKYGDINLTPIEPDDITGLQLWLKADVGITESGGAISLWEDQSGNNRDADQPNVTLRPNYVTGALNGLPVVRYDGTGETLQTIGFQIFPSKRGSIFIVNKGIYGMTNGYMFRGTDFDISWGNTGITNKYKNIARNTFYPSQGELDLMNNYYGWNGYLIFELIRTTNTNFNIYVSGRFMGALSLMDWTTINEEYNIGGGDLTGDIAEVIVYDKALSDVERFQVERHLSDKWALTMFHAL